MYILREGIDVYDKLRSHFYRIPNTILLTYLADLRLVQIVKLDLKWGNHRNLYNSIHDDT